MEKQKNIPALRFPEFKGEWESKILGDLLEFKNGINASKEQYGHGVKFINVLDILNNEFITYDKIIGSVDVDTDTVEKYPVKYGDILFQRSSETREEVGTACVYLDKEKTATFGGFVIRGRKIGEYVPVFLNNLLKTDLSRDDITSKSGGSTRYNVGQGILSSVSLFFPTLPEQQKIATFLTSVDTKLTQLNQKKTLLEQYKKGVLQKLFSQEFRFKDENGNVYADWEVKKMNDILSIPEKIRAEKIDKEKLLTVRLHLKGVFKNENTDGLTIGATNYYIRRKGQFIYGKQNLFNGAFGIIPDEFDGYISSSDIPSLEIDNTKINSKFLFYFFSREDYYKRLEEIASGSGSKRIHENILLENEIIIPTIAEQTKISNFLSSIDDKISYCNSQIEKMEMWKKGLLQKMFC